MSSLVLENSYSSKINKSNYPYSIKNNSEKNQKSENSTYKSDFIEIKSRKNLFDNIFETKNVNHVSFSNIEIDREKNKILNIKSIPNEITKEEFINILKSEISWSLKTTSDKIRIDIDKNDILLVNLETNEKFKLEFDDKDDKYRFKKYLLLSSNNILSNLGNNNNVKKIRINDYEDGLTRESQIQLFKEDISREMKNEIREIQIMLVDNTIYTIDDESKNVFQIEFQDINDFERFLKYASESKSKRLEDFGLRKIEAVVSVGGSTSFTKSSNTLGENITYSRFIGEDGTQKIKVIANTDFNLTTIPNKNNIKDITISYENSDLPWVNSYGNVQISYKEGNFGIDGKLDYIDMQVDKIGKRLEKEWKEDKPKVILAGIGALALVGVTVYAGTKLLKEEKDFDVPVNTKLYDNGVLEVRAGIAPKVTIGNDNLNLDMKRANLELKQNIASGTNIRESFKYDIEQKKLETDLELNYDRANLRIKNNTSFKDENQNSTYISLGKSYTLTDEVNIAYSYSQEFDKDFKPKNSSLNIGVEYAPNDDWRFNVGGGVSLPNSNSKPSYNANFRVTHRF
ncbi:MAG: hypothetical protein KatS3mg068_2025 [Candidatus Sericytochromatia bacterium]|nr:MAG: hypothetical protein KatS3mg068_2025 [Candidatus Sericytochromatia bacterium]